MIVIPSGVSACLFIPHPAAFVSAEVSIDIANQAYCAFEVPRALRFIGGGGGGFLAREGGGGGGAFFPAGKPALRVVELTVREGALPYDVAGETDRSPYDRSGLLLVYGDSSDGSPNTSFAAVLTRLAGRS